MKSLIKLLFLSILIGSCGGKDNPPAPPQPEVKELGAFNLVFPDNNLICTEGEDTGNDEVSINFMWTASANATGYDLEINNQDTGAKINETSSTTSKTVTLPKGVQFTWTITAKLGEDTKASDSWSFYSEGTAQENYAPFPATITVADNGDATISIEWSGADLDDDIVSYEVYFGTTEDPDLVHSATDDSAGLTQSIVYGSDHFLSIVTIDGLGNKSTSKKTINFQEQNGYGALVAQIR